MNRCIPWLLTAAFVLGMTLPATSSAADKKLKAVLWIGGFAHDYDAYAKIISETVPKHVPIEIEVVRDGGFLDRPAIASILSLLTHPFFSGTLTGRSLADRGLRIRP